MPDFQQFADKLDRLIKQRAKNGYSDSIQGPALRHARLLQAVWEWANSPTKTVFDVPGDVVIGASVDSHKAHVRSLLQPTPPPPQLALCDCDQPRQPDVRFHAHDCEYYKAVASPREER